MFPFPLSSRYIIKYVTYFMRKLVPIDLAIAECHLVSLDPDHPDIWGISTSSVLVTHFVSNPLQPTGC